MIPNNAGLSLQKLFFPLFFDNSLRESQKSQRIVSRPPITRGAFFTQRVNMLNFKCLDEENPDSHLKPVFRPEDLKIQHIYFLKNYKKARSDNRQTGQNPYSSCFSLWVSRSRWMTTPSSTSFIWASISLVRIEKYSISFLGTSP